MGIRGTWIFIPDRNSGSGDGEIVGIILTIIAVCLIFGFAFGFIRPTYEYEAYDEKSNKTYFLMYQKWIFGDEVNGIYTTVYGDVTENGTSTSFEDKPESCFKGTIDGNGDMVLVCKKINNPDGEVLNVKPMNCSSNRASLSWLDFDLYGGRNWLSVPWERWAFDEFKPYDGFKTQP